MSDSTQPTQLHLVLGDEELLVERAVHSVIAAVRAHVGVVGDALPVDRLRAGDAVSAELAELLSPSLFAEDRVVVFEAAGEAGKDAAALLLEAAEAPPEGVVLVVVHSGGGRAKALAPALEKVGATVHDCAKLKPGDLVDFARGEFRTLGVRVSVDVVQAIIEAVGNDARQIASACSQLAADTGGKIDIAAVRKYYSGNATVTGFDVADLAVAGNRAATIEALRWAIDKGVPPVLLADALADAVLTIARVGSAGRGDPFKLAGRLGLPPWKVKKSQALVQAWSPAKISAALRVVADLNADVKGAAASAEYALERAVDQILELR